MAGSGSSSASDPLLGRSLEVWRSCVMVDFVPEVPENALHVIALQSQAPPTDDGPCYY